MKISLFLFNLLFINLVASANCNEVQAELNCDFYRQCLEHKTQCGDAGYAISYGEKYCQKFLKLNTNSEIENLSLSEKGVQWRDATLLCLQNRMTPLFQSASDYSCSSIQKMAFKTHPDCYTQKNRSICDLNISDWEVILSTLNPKDLSSQDGLRQMTKVMYTCTKSIFSQKNKFWSLKNEWVQKINLLKNADLTDQSH
jgi:hypothetical protein